MNVFFTGLLLGHSKHLNDDTIDFKGQVLESRREIHERLGECESRPVIHSWARGLQDWQDCRKGNKLWQQCDGWFAWTTKPERIKS